MFYGHILISQLNIHAEILADVAFAPGGRGWGRRAPELLAIVEMSAVWPSVVVLSHLWGATLAFCASPKSRAAELWGEP